MHKKRTISLFLLVIYCVLPIIVLFALSFSLNWIYPNILPRTFTLRHWKEFLFDGNGLQQSFFNSLTIALFVAFTATLLGFICSKWIAYHKQKRLLLLVTYFPFALSPVIFAICLKFYFLKAGLAGNLSGIIIAQLIIAFPYATIFFTSFWNNSIKDYSNIAGTLGSSPFNSYLKIIFPLAKSFLITCFFQCFIISWFEYGLTNIIGYGKVQTLTIRVFQFIGEANIFYAALSSCLLILPPVILLWLNKKFVLHHTR
jgi:putative spermidine/putrescine transport system permease protein